MSLLSGFPEGKKYKDRLFLRACNSFRAGRYYDAATLFKEAYEEDGEKKWLLINYATSIRNAGHIDFAGRIYQALKADFPREQRLHDLIRKTRRAARKMDEGKDPSSLLGVPRFENRPGFPQRECLVREDLHNTSISLCMIVRNEEGSIRRAIESVAFLMDEIVVVDTGSTDNTIKILESLGITPYHKEWTDDFSEARNYALSKATKDWILVLDADETISYFDVFYLKEAIVENPDLWGFTLNQRDYSDLPLLAGTPCKDDGYEEARGYKNFAIQQTCRLFKNIDKVRFSYPVYEIVEESIKLNGGNFGHTEIPIHHYGRLLPMEQMFKKRRYYISILEQQLRGSETGERKAIYCGNIARAYMFMQEIKKAVVYLCKGLEFNPKSSLLHFDLGNNALLRNDTASAVEWFEKAIEFAGHEPFVEPYLRAVQCHMATGNVGRAIELCQRCLEVAPGEPRAEHMLGVLEGTF